jgi:ABC-2 type transport system ATP-binding protein
VHWKGRPVDRDARLRFGYMPEQRGLYPRMRVGEQLTYFAQQHGLSGRDANAAGKRWLERMGLGDRAKSKLEELSHGNQQRVQLSVALAHDPELLVLDEPFSGLDPIGIATMTDVVQERAAAGVGVVFSSHQLDLVEDVCEDVVIIAKGRIVAAGAIDALKAASGRRHLEIEVDGSDGSWLDGDGSLTILERSDGRIKLLVGEDVDLDGLLARARAAGEIRRFAYQPPKLSELFMEAVAPDGDGAGEPAEVTT